MALLSDRLFWRRGVFKARSQSVYRGCHNTDREVRECSKLQLSLSYALLHWSSRAFSRRSVLSQDEGTPKMREVADAIRVGAEAFIKRQYSTIAGLAIVLAIVIFCVYFLTGQQGLP